MPVCDVCNTETQFANGYLLTTSQVVTKKAYWIFAFKNQWAYTQTMDPQGMTIPMLAENQAGQSTAWLVCESCSKLFEFDRAKAKEYAKRKSDPPGTGRANAAKTALAAARAWKKVFGNWPPSVPKGSHSSEMESEPAKSGCGSLVCIGFGVVVAAWSVVVWLV